MGVDEGAEPNEGRGNECYNELMLNGVDEGDRLPACRKLQ